MASIRLFDIVFFVLFLGLVVVSVFITVGGVHGANQIEVKSADSAFYLPLSEDGSLEVDGPIGMTTITVMDGVARVTHSDCRDKVCMSMGEISRQSAWIACLPNKVFIRVVPLGQNSSAEVDAGAY